MFQINFTPTLMFDVWCLVLLWEILTIKYLLSHSFASWKMIKKRMKSNEKQKIKWKAKNQMNSKKIKIKIKKKQNSLLVKEKYKKRKIKFQVNKMMFNCDVPLQWCSIAMMFIGFHVMKAMKWPLQMDNIQSYKC